MKELCNAADFYLFQTALLLQETMTHLCSAMRGRRWPTIGTARCISSATRVILNNGNADITLPSIQTHVTAFHFLRSMKQKYDRKDERVKGNAHTKQDYIKTHSWKPFPHPTTSIPQWKSPQNKGQTEALDDSRMFVHQRSRVSQDYSLFRCYFLVLD